jgi:hypothetical protein
VQVFFFSFFLQLVSFCLVRQVEQSSSLPLSFSIVEVVLTLRRCGVKCVVSGATHLLFQCSFDGLIVCHLQQISSAVLKLICSFVSGADHFLSLTYDDSAKLVSCGHMVSPQYDKDPSL